MTADRTIIHNPAFPCSCTVLTTSGGVGQGLPLSIDYCSVHGAAPDLLAALQDAHACIFLLTGHPRRVPADTVGILTRARAAIAKATGGAA